MRARGDLKTQPGEPVELGPAGAELAESTTVETALVQAVRGAKTESKPFAVELPAELPDGKDGRSQEESNQERMFAVRELFVSSKSGERFAWVAQAIEAYRRALTSDFADFGVIRSIAIDPRREIVFVRSEGDQMSGDVVHELSFADLKPYSLELALQESEGGKEQVNIEYSPDMQSKIDALKPSARFRWDLVVRTAYQESLGKNKTQYGTFQVRPVVGDLLTNNINGVGVFLVHDDKVGRAQLFSVVKLVGDDVPLTEREQNIISRAKCLHHPEYAGPKVKELVEILSSVFSDLKNIAEKDSRVRKLFEEITGRLGADNSQSLYRQFSELFKRLSDHSIFVGLELSDQLKAAVIQAKGKFDGPLPCELASLPLELSARVQVAAKELVEIIMAIAELLTAKKDKVIALLAANTDESKIKAVTPVVAKMQAKHRARTAERLRALPLGLESGGDLNKLLSANVGVDRENDV